jgi:hypothetical protein
LLGSGFQRRTSPFFLVPELSPAFATSFSVLIIATPFSLVARKTCPQSCSLATTFVLSLVYTAVTWQWMSQYIIHLLLPFLRLYVLCSLVCFNSELAILKVGTAYTISTTAWMNRFTVKSLPTFVNRSAERIYILKLMHLTVLTEMLFFINVILTAHAQLCSHSSHVTF